MVVRELPAGHVAAPGRGAFAGSLLHARTPLLVYGGELVSDAQADARGVLPGGDVNGFLFNLSATAGMACDPSATPRCRAAYVNDPRGSGADANCTFVEVWCGGGCHSRAATCSRAAAAAAPPPLPVPVHAHAVLCATRDIAPGEELLVSYGDAYWAGRSRAGRAVETKPYAVTARSAASTLRIAPTMQTAAGADNTSHTRINVLDAELLCRVFGCLTCAEDLAAVAVAQRAWRSLLRATPSLWRAVTFRPALALAPRPARRVLAVAAAAAGQLESLDLRPLGNAAILTLVLNGDTVDNKGKTFGADDYSGSDEDIAAAAASEEDEQSVRSSSSSSSSFSFSAEAAIPFGHKHVRNTARLRAALAHVAASNLRLHRLAISASAVCADEWATAATRGWLVAKVLYDGDTSLTVGPMWAPQALTALARTLPPRVALTADVTLGSVDGVKSLLALHAARQLSLDALTLCLGHRYAGEACCAALATALAPAGGWLGRELRHVVIEYEDEKHGWHYEPLLEALADGGAPALHTLEMRHASPASVRHVAALLHSGDAAFSLKRLAVLMDEAAADALLALAAALPPTLHTLVLEMPHGRGHDSYEDSEPRFPALRALLDAAVARCPALRSVQLGTSDDYEFAPACRAMMDDFAAAHPDLRVSFRACPRPRGRKSVGGTTFGGAVPKPLAWAVGYGLFKY